MAEADGFEVDIEALYKACLAIRRIASEMKDSPVRDLDCGNAFGHEELSGVADEFSRRWQRGVKNLLIDAEAIDNRLSDNLEAYRIAENDAIRAFNLIYEGGGVEAISEE